MADSDDVKVGGLLLAAGGSSRLGYPKQLIEFEGRTLLRRAAEALDLSGCSPAVVVLGAGHELAAAELAGLRITPVINPEWQAGIGSSIALGLQALLAAKPDISAVIITLCDQPFVTSETIQKFLLKFKHPLQYYGARKSIIAAVYEGVPGVPALFAKGLFGSLLSLMGDEGARRIIRTAAADTIELIEVGAAAIDVDSAEDVRRLSLFTHIHGRRNQ